MSTSTQSLAGTAAAKPLGWVSWSLAQGARDPYYIMVVIYIFLPYFASTVVNDPVRGQSLIGYITSTAGIILAVVAPFLGAIADKNPRRKPWLAIMLSLMAIGSFSLWFITPSSDNTAIWAFTVLLILINTCFGISEVFHNAMLPTIAPANRVGIVSGLAFAFGNFSALGLMLFVLIAFALPGSLDWSFIPETPLFALDQTSHEDDRIVGPLAAVWMLLLSVPLFLFSPDGKSSQITVAAATRQGIKDLLTTLKQLRHYKNIALYLLARMFFSDGMSGVLVFGGVYASGTFDWDTIDLLMFGLSTSAAAVVGACLGGWLDDRLGSRSTLQFAIIASTIILLLMVSIQPNSVLFFIPISNEPVWSFPFLQTLSELIYIGMCGFFAVFFVTALSSARALMARISPPEMATQFFGLYALSGTVTAFLAPLLVAVTTDFFASQKIGFASLAVLIIIGSVMLLKVREERASVAPS